MYNLNVAIDNKQLIFYIVNTRQPFSTQFIYSSENEKIILPYGILKTHTNYKIIDINSDDDEVPIKYKHTIDIEIKLFKNLLPVLIDNINLQFKYKRDRCCC